MTHFRFDFSFCIACELIIASLIAVFTALGQYSLVSLLFAFSFVLAFGYSGLHVNKNRYTGVLTVLVMLCFFNVTIDGFLEDGLLDFNYFKKVLMFLAFVLLLCFAAEKGCSVSTSVGRLIEILPVLACIFLIFSYYFLGNTKTIALGITLGFSNPNFAGMWLLHFFLYDCLFIFRVWNGKSKWRLLCVPVAIITWGLVLATRARSCMIGVVAFFVLVGLGFRKKRANKLLLAGIALLPILYAIVYLQVVYSDWFYNLFGFMISVGKKLTSRVAIWNYGFEAFGRHPLLGSYAGISGGTGVSQLHNTHIDVLVSYGVFPFVLFIKILYDVMLKTNKQGMSFYQYAAFCAFCAVIIMGTFEAAMVSGAMGMNLLTVGLLVLANYESDDICREEKRNI